ncbi:hypothetical protein I3F58_12315 [Streptomyces sp. MUM 203J]|uniref:hypothetical protein n=1 Tax=Streptomyces sp. MUM 203J TaxID=2791990 RepID=UPI001F042C23|nr:hypothetical protein [Streptomyces sp. MUM 203J]MCH0540338.1 hypothetical protein [Streptomyces sp. MUM 203J]
MKKEPGAMERWATGSRPRTAAPCSRRTPVRRTAPLVAGRALLHERHRMIAAPAGQAVGFTRQAAQVHPLSAIVRHEAEQVPHAVTDDPEVTDRWARGTEH